MDRGAWWAMVQRVTKRWTEVSDLARSCQDPPGRAPSLGPLRGRFERCYREARGTPSVEAGLLSCFSCSVSWTGHIASLGPMVQPPYHPASSLTPQPLLSHPETSLSPRRYETQQDHGNTLT